ncbi:HNH endonuclease [Streptomyces sp. NPDC057757]
MQAHPSTDLTADHVVPLARGGSSTPENTRVLCRSCNSRKHSQ